MTKRLTKTHKGATEIQASVFERHENVNGTMSRRSVLEHTIEESEDEVIFNACFVLSKKSREYKKIMEKLVQNQQSPISDELLRIEKERNIEVEEGKNSPLYKI